MKSPIRFAFLTAMPVEAANLYFRDSFADFRISAGGISLDKLLDYQFRFIHWPGLYVSYWFDGLGFPRLGIVATAASGYLDTALLLTIAVFVFGWLFSKRANRSSPPDDPVVD